jgi:aryl-alcohol dehydrogenase-like predicted oxidoreductase
MQTRVLGSTGVRVSPLCLGAVCQQYAMGVIAWSPLAGGWLTGRYRKDGELPASRRAGSGTSRTCSTTLNCWPEWVTMGRPRVTAR